MGISTKSVYVYKRRKLLQNITIKLMKKVSIWGIEVDTFSIISINGKIGNTFFNKNN